MNLHGKEETGTRPESPEDPPLLSTMKGEGWTTFCRSIVEGIRERLQEPPGFKLRAAIVRELQAQRTNKEQRTRNVQRTNKERTRNAEERGTGKPMAFLEGTPPPS